MLVLKHNEASGAEAHYEFLRSALRDDYAAVAASSVDFLIERRMRVFDEVASIPVLLSLLILCLRTQVATAAATRPPCLSHPRTRRVGHRRFPTAVVFPTAVQTRVSR